MSEWKIDGRLPDGVDPNGLVVTFAIEGEDVKGRDDIDGGGQVLGWVDMKVVPAAGDFILGAALGLDANFVRVVTRVWVDHNWVKVLIEHCAAPDGES